MTHQAISLDAIDFSNPDGEFTFRGETYLLKKHLSIDFIRNKKHVGLEFICRLDHIGYDNRAYIDSQQHNSLQVIGELIENNNICIYRCIHYKEALFSFGNGKDKYYSPEHNQMFAFGNIQDYYYPPESNQWICLRYINCKRPEKISLDDVLEKSYDFFIERAAIVFSQELPLIGNDDIFHSFIDIEEVQIEFIRGSELELKRLTKLAVTTLPELQLVFNHFSWLIVSYSSYDSARHIGDIFVDETWSQLTVPKSAQQLFNIIFEYNFFTGFSWEEYDSGLPAYACYFRRPLRIIVEVQAPSQHERIEAALELQSWLEGKLPDDEIRACIEG